MSEAQNGGNVMERLTKRLPSGAADYNYPKSCYIGDGSGADRISQSAFRQRCVERLADYEDTGLTPGEVKSMQEEHFSGLEMAKLHSALMELKKYQEADKDGRLVALPCKDWLEVVFGDQVLFWGIDKDYVEQPIREISLDDADRIGWYDGYKTVFLKGTDENGEAWEFYPEEIGKTVFLTREEAEAALEAMKDGNG